MLLREVDRRLGLAEAISECLRAPLYVVHEQQTMLAQRTFAITTGYEDRNDHQTFRDDPARQTAAGHVTESGEPLDNRPVESLP